MVFDRISAKEKESPRDYFQDDRYLRHNHRRLEHLASLGLDFRRKTVLEVGAGIGDHTHFFLDRFCQVISTDARTENLAILQSRYPNIETFQLDMENPNLSFERTFDIVYCYGLLYHLQNPAQAIEFMARNCHGILLLETCVSYGEEEAINLCNEYVEDPTQSYCGQGCKPTRKWVYKQLERWFDFVYMPTTQPNHEEFPIDWTCHPSTMENPRPSLYNLTRSIYIASKSELYNSTLVRGIPMKQIYH